MPPVAFRDYYEVLGVPRDASAEDIRKGTSNQKNGNRA